jgi:hypothetical protein
MEVGVGDASDGAEHGPLGAFSMAMKQSYGSLKLISLQLKFSLYFYLAL